MRHVTIASAGQTTDVTVPTEKDWGALVDVLSPQLRPGVILAVRGDLGAGKTTFIQTLAASLGVVSFVPSPTFALMRSYKLRKAIGGIRRLIHVDAYRLKDERELQVLDLDEELADGVSLLVVEWPERIAIWLERHASKVINLNIR